MRTDDGLNKGRVDARIGRPRGGSGRRQDLLVSAALAEGDGDTDGGGAAIPANAGLDRLGAGCHAASRWVAGLPVSSPTKEVTPSIRSWISTRSVRTSTRSTRSWMMRACS